MKRQILLMILMTFICAVFIYIFCLVYNLTKPKGLVEIQTTPNATIPAEVEEYLKSQETTTIEETKPIETKPIVVLKSIEARLVDNDFYIGDSIQNFNFVVVGEYTDGHKEQISDFIIYPTELTEKENEITITKDNFNTNIIVNAQVKEIKPIDISASINKKCYIGDTIDSSYFTVTVKSDQGDTYINPDGVQFTNTKLENMINYVNIIYKDVYTVFMVTAQDRSMRPTIGKTELIKLITDYQNSENKNFETNVLLKQDLEDFYNKAPNYSKIWSSILEKWSNISNQIHIDSEKDTCFVVAGFKLNSDGSMSSELLSRLQTALDYAKAYPQTYILCTGGKTGGNITEAAVMRNWLVLNGINKNRILTEDKSISTTENALYSIKILETLPIKNLIIITSDYHIPATTFLFNAQCILSGDNIKVTSYIPCYVSSTTKFSASTIANWTYDLFVRQ